MLYYPKEKTTQGSHEDAQQVAGIVSRRRALAPTKGPSSSYVTLGFFDPDWLPVLQPVPLT